MGDKRLGEVPRWRNRWALTLRVVRQCKANHRSVVPTPASLPHPAGLGKRIFSGNFLPGRTAGGNCGLRGSVWGGILAS